MVSSECLTHGSEHLVLLSELTEALPSVPCGRPPAVRYLGEGGDWEGSALHWEDAVAVQICHAGKGVTLPADLHPESRERLLVYQGSLSVISKDGTVAVYRAGDCADFEPGQSHTVVTLEPTSIIAVTIPAEESYPHGNERANPTC